MIELYVQMWSCKVEIPWIKKFWVFFLMWLMGFYHLNIFSSKTFLYDTRNKRILCKKIVFIYLTHVFRMFTFKRR
jgi:hypothetical protein